MEEERKRKRERGGKQEGASFFHMFMRRSVRKRRKSLVPSASGLKCLSISCYADFDLEFNGN